MLRLDDVATTPARRGRGSFGRSEARVSLDATDHLGLIERETLAIIITWGAGILGAACSAADVVKLCRCC